MEIYSVLLINTDSSGKTHIKGIFESFKKAKEYILEEIKYLLDDEDNWYRNHGSKKLKNFADELESNWKIRTFDIYQIEKHTVK